MHETNVAVEYEDGWIWYDEHGRDYGPYSTKEEALVKGRLASIKEEKLLRKSQ